MGLHLISILVRIRFASRSVSGLVFGYASGSASRFLTWFAFGSVTGLASGPETSSGLTSGSAYSFVTWSASGSASRFHLGLHPVCLWPLGLDLARYPGLHHHDHGLHPALRFGQALALLGFKNYYG